MVVFMPPKMERYQAEADPRRVGPDLPFTRRQDASLRIAINELQLPARLIMLAIKSLAPLLLDTSSLLLSCLSPFSLDNE